jgi:hypothetical protein
MEWQNAFSNSMTEPRCHKNVHAVVMSSRKLFKLVIISVLKLLMDANERQLLDRVTKPEINAPTH